MILMYPKEACESWLLRSLPLFLSLSLYNDVCVQVLTLQELEDAFATGHEALDEQSTRDDSLVGSQIREREARNSAASGSAGGFSYGEFYRLLAEVPSCPHPAATGMSASGYASQVRLGVRAASSREVC